MAISSVKIQRFTVFDESFIKFSPGINVIIGENATGKTHLLKGIYALCKNLNKPSMTSLGYDFSEYFNVSFMELMRKVEVDNESSFKVIFDKPDKNVEWKVEKDTEREQISIADLTNRQKPVYIPTKDFLTHSQGFMSLYDNTKISFDKSYYDIISKALLPVAREIPVLALTILPQLEKFIDGKVVVDNDIFFIHKNTGEKIKFSVEAEGIKKFGLLWQLLMNESITKDTILLWDEAEANINPKLIPDIVEILLELSRQGVQIFLATHSYLFAKYFEVKRKKEDSVLFHSLFKTNKGVICETNINFRDLHTNSIISSFDKLLDEVYFLHVED